jgi:hypothetical protein
MKFRFVMALGFVLLAGVPAFAGTGYTIKNEAVEAVYDSATGEFTLAARSSGKVFLRGGKFSSPGGKADLVTVKDPVFGAGRAIEVRGPNGNRDRILLFPKLPFALLRSSLRNEHPDIAVLRRYEPFTAAVDVGRPTAGVKTLGTGGLLEPDKNPGSYVWLAYVDPASRNGVVAAWLTHERGSGVLFSDATNGTLRLRPRIDYGRLRVAPGNEAEFETLAVGYFDDARLGLEQWAEAVAAQNHIALPVQPTGYCTWYSNPNGGASDEGHLKELTAYSASHLAPSGFTVVQIDDGWQAGISTNGPKRNFTTHAPQGPYPSGMAAIAGAIHKSGLTPGLWFMPFAGTYYDPFFKDHQNWFVKRQDGAPYETDWGGTCLDLTHPEVLEYLRANIHRIAHEWGFTYFKMDGLWTGTATKQQYVNEGYREDGIGDALHFNPDKANIEAYRDGFKTIRRAAGTNVFILGCCIPQNMRSYGAAFGLVDAMRIGPDNGADWEGLKRGPTFGTRHYFLNRRVWYNDPDPVYVRESVPLNQARLICSWVAISGQLNLSSEWLPGLSADRLDILKRTMPSHGLLPRPVDLFDRALPSIWLLADPRKDGPRDVVALYNWGDTAETFDESCERIGLDRQAEYQAFSYWDNRMVDSFQGRVRLTVPAQSCAILAVRPVGGHPQVLSTSRHVTQGIVDLAEEHWIPVRDALRGRSLLVAGEPYEIRIPLQTKTARWKVGKITAVCPNRPETPAISHTEDSGLLRLTINVRTAGEVAWTVGFEKQ